MFVRRFARAAGLAGLWLGLLGVVALTPASAAGGGAQPSIIGGHAGSIAELPSLAFLEGGDGTGGFSCTGTVVAPRVILTAGHCVEDIEAGTITPASSYAVATGVANLKQLTKANVSAVSQVLVFPGFKPSKLQGDAGILILSAPVAAPVLPMASAGDKGLLEAGTPLTLAGWGLTDASSEEPPAQLQTGSSVVQDPDFCRAQSRRYYPFYAPELQLCGEDIPSHGVSNCFGDSGGPAIAKHPDGSPVEVGIVSTGGPGCSRNLPDIYTRVDLVSAWVASWVAAVEAGAPAPEIKIPKAHPPFLSFAHAEELAAVGFAEDFRNHFRRATNKGIACTRVDKEKVKCRVAWYQGGNDYFGSTTIYYAIHGNSVIWNDRYKIHWVNHQCFFHSGEPGRCRIHTRSR
ncbi:MAG: serine protease [Solirubrobacterales bacterium]|nr:serine protease [Solirubrobacterales bacterium]